MALDDIPFHRPFIGKEEEEAVLRVLRSGWLTTGQEALAFEKEFADFLQENTLDRINNHNIMVVESAITEIGNGAEEATAKGIRPDLNRYGGDGDVTFIWGNEKKGLYHIGYRRGAEVTANVIKTVITGKIVRTSEVKKTVTLSDNGYEAVLSLDFQGNTQTWLLTGWKENAPDVTGEVCTQSGTTQIRPTFSRSDLGAGTSKILNELMQNVNNKPSGDPLFCLAVNSATSGLHLALEACGAGPGDTVLVPSLTFTSTAEVVRYLGAEVVFVDVALGSFQMDPAALERTLDRLSRGLPAYGGSGCKGGFGPKGTPRAVMPVHYGGLPGDMRAIMSIARRYGIKVIEDAAHAFPSRTESGEFAGTLGDAGVFSFYATKTITTGEGGMVATRDTELAARISIMRSHGIDRAVWNRYTESKASWYYEVVAPGFKYNLPDILAALGRVQLQRAWRLLEERQHIAARYDDAFACDERFILPPGGTGNARHLYPLRLASPALSRDTVIERLQDRGIGVSVHFIPLHTMPYYRNQQGLTPEDFPETLQRFREVISLPIWPGMGEARIDRVIAAVREVSGGN
ncbi:hypothetical protein AGMMS49944_09230 [Spirochaetia bacterium]|nr:hypothetical protein AGMMS49944_09230 [Spirochaetia bacterium]